MVQGLRHDANYIPKDTIALMIDTQAYKTTLEKNANFLKKEVGAKSIEFKKTGKFDAELNSKLNEEPIWIGVKKI